MTTHCPKCGGAGWLWWKELDEYDGPAIKGGCDDTRYSCDHECHDRADDMTDDKLIEAVARAIYEAVYIGTEPEPFEILVPSRHVGWQQVARSTLAEINGSGTHQVVEIKTIKESFAKVAASFREMGMDDAAVRVEKAAGILEDAP